jgi:hypothetical protein
MKIYIIPLTSATHKTGNLVFTNQLPDGPGNRNRLRRRAPHRSIPSKINNSRGTSRRGVSASMDAVLNRPCSSRLLQMQYPVLSHISTFTMVACLLKKTKRCPLNGSAPKICSTQPDSPSKDFRRSIGILQANTLIADGKLSMIRHALILALSAQRQAL